MDDSNLFMQWAMDTLQQHQYPAAAAYGGGADSFPPLQALPQAGVPTEDHRTNSWSSGDTDGGGGGSAIERDGWSPSSVRAQSGGGGGSGRPMSWNFRAASVQPNNEGPRDAAAAAAEVVYGSSSATAPARRASNASPASPYAQDHIIAERKRREKINERFIELSTVIPGLKKMDKATILADAVRYVKELQDKLNALEGQGAKNIESVVLVKEPCFSGPDEEGGPSSPAMPAERPGSSRKALPEIEARFLEKSVMVRIHCENVKGVLVRVLAEVEQLRLSITHTNVMPFLACTAILTITAKVEEGFNMSVEEVVRRLNSALHQDSSSSSHEETRN